MEDGAGEISAVGDQYLYEARSMTMSSLTTFFMMLAGACLVLYAMTVPLPYQGETDSFVHTLSLYGFGFFGMIAYLSSQEDK